MASQISDDVLAHLGERYYQADQASYWGSGSGLIDRGRDSDRNWVAASNSSTPRLAAGCARCLN